ncbi:hypothetical protein CHS0354_028919 [Potamilus streckersoni]|uniref:AIG1-type G domain-containing protein n=1 Tax=Potamilus streckersoni TaxID=2493646 RepID=A0AAE0VW48_9BIVA|nr:hypothetical protein CHS0354_028919 [Potamilus streckersoni]
MIKEKAIAAIQFIVSVISNLYLKVINNIPYTEYYISKPDDQSILTPRPAIRALPPGDPLNLVLLGKTGHGKSALGNTIFGEEKFESQLSSCSVKTKCKMEHGVIGGREIFLVDTPGTMDTNDPDSALLEISHAITFRPDGFHAFLIVLNPTVRMTKEEHMAVILLKKMFGEDVLIKYTVLVFTHGDDYSRQMENAKINTSFRDYISSQGGELGQLVNECNFRCVLVNNMERDATAVNEQVRELINSIDELVSQNDKKMYTNELFEFARMRIEEETKKYLEQLSERSLV